MTDQELKNRLLDMARAAGARYPTLAETGPDDPPLVILDTDTGRTWRIELREF